MPRILANRVTHLVKTFARNKLGSVMLMSGLMMPVLIGFAGLGLDVTIWYLAKRQIQTAADAGAIAGAHTLAKGGSKGAAQQAADIDVELNDFAIDATNTSTAHIPPITGAYAGDNNAIEVYVTLSQPLYFAALFGAGPIDIRARAVAAKLASGPGSCVLGLDPTMDGTVEFSGNSIATIKCGVTSNSNSDESIFIFGNATLDADPVYAYGDITLQGNPDFYYDEPPVTYGYPADDPYENLTVPTDPVNCDQGSGITHITSNPGKILLPGRYCGGIKITDSTATFLPGVYILDRGHFETSGTSTLIGDGVTFIFTATDGFGNFGPAAEIGNLKIVGGTIATLSAPTSGDYQGILFFQDQRAPCCQGAPLIKNSVLGGSETIFTGALYFPNQEIEYSGGSDTVETCMLLVSDKITFTGTSYLSSTPENCEAVGIDLITQYWVRLVE
ncbi:MAG: hypothetical protein IIA72_14115 [Proteobacteria bacterium]|nr:hypothetical protein [Pseudomonadota bacterium]